MKTKRQYIAPTFKVVDFKVENGFYGSMYGMTECMNDGNVYDLGGEDESSSDHMLEPIHDHYPDGLAWVEF